MSKYIFNKLINNNVKITNTVTGDISFLSPDKNVSLLNKHINNINTYIIEISTSSDNKKMYDKIIIPYNEIDLLSSVPTFVATTPEDFITELNTKYFFVVVNISIDSISVNTGHLRVPNIIRTNGIGIINSIVYDFTVANVGNLNGFILNNIIKPGESLSFEAGAINNYYASNIIVYDGTDTELIIIYNN
jgi:hypothetical protein